MDIQTWNNWINAAKEAGTFPEGRLKAILKDDLWTDWIAMVNSSDSEEVTGRTEGNA